MFLIHKVLRGEADRTVEQAKCLEDGCSLQSFKMALAAWATAIMYHAEKEVGTAMSKFVDVSRRTAVCDHRPPRTARGHPRDRLAMQGFFRCGPVVPREATRP